MYIAESHHRYNRLNAMNIRVRAKVRVRVSVRVRFCGHYVDFVAANCGRPRLQPTVTR